MYDPLLNINDSNSIKFIQETLDEIKHTGIESLTKSPMNHMVRWIPEPKRATNDQERMIAGYMLESQERDDEATRKRLLSLMNPSEKVTTYKFQKRIDDIFIRESQQVQEEAPSGDVNEPFGPPDEEYSSGLASPKGEVSSLI